MRHRLPIITGILIAAIMLLPATVASAQLPGLEKPSKQKSGSELVRLDAYTVADAIRTPGTTLVAVRFRIDPKWHIYWRNPGESGTSPEVRITGPTGLAVGPILWPRPVVFRNQWETTYGYADETTLLVPVTIDRSLDGPVALTVEADWLVCEEVCLFGSGRTTLDLAPRSEAITDGAHAAALSAAQARLPRDLATMPGARIRMSDPTPDGGRTLVLEGPLGDATAATFVPDLTPGVEIGDGLPVPATIAEGRFTLDLELDVQPANALDGRLEVAGVVLLGNRAGDPAFQIRIPLESPAPTGANPETPVQDRSIGSPNRP